MTNKQYYLSNHKIKETVLAFNKYILRNCTEGEIWAEKHGKEVYENYIGQDYYNHEDNKYYNLDELYEFWLNQEHDE